MNEDGIIVRCIPLDEIDWFCMTCKPTEKEYNALIEEGFIQHGTKDGKDFYIKKELLFNQNI